MKKVSKWVFPLLAGTLLGCGGKGGTPAADLPDAGADDGTLCTEGALGCPCRAGAACDGDLVCHSGVCGVCTAGSEGCACFPDGRCDAGLRCGTGLRCVTCPDGTEGCACYGNKTCNDPLACENGTCIQKPVCIGDLGCPCDGQDRCTAGSCSQPGACRCDKGACVTCTSDVVGCACPGGTCAALVCDAGLCRVARPCSAAGCVEHQKCSPSTPAADAVCAPACETGFDWVTDHCEAKPGINCKLGDPASILADCQSQHKSCEPGPPAHCGGCDAGYKEVETVCVTLKNCADCKASNQECAQGPGDHTDAVCGACLPGFESKDGLCVPSTTLVTCAELATLCAEKHRKCQDHPGANATCEGCVEGFLEDPQTGACRLPVSCKDLASCLPPAKKCVEGEPGKDATCVASGCPLCDGPNEDGPYPEFTQEGKCICKTLPGYFYFLGLDVGTFPCDRDGDGWVRQSAKYALESKDKAIRDNARCELRTVDRFVLHNEGGQKLPLALDTPLPLYETDRNDDVDVLKGTLPVYGTGGRPLEPRELNSLTKACVSANADFNDNKLADVKEWARPPLAQIPVDASLGLSEDMVPLVAVYTRFSYFLELHRAWYEPPTSGETHGSYHIREKVRAVHGAGGGASSDGFPIRYGPEGKGQDAPYTSDYWQDCPRARDGWYDELFPPIGMDFASVSGPDPVFKGMNHHSQFKCVQVLDETAYADLKKQQPQQVPDSPDQKSLNPQFQTLGTLAELESGIGWQPDACVATNKSAVAPDQAPNPYDPVIECKPVPDAKSSDVLWAAVRIQTDATKYRRGCVVQCPGQPYLCPGSDPAVFPPPSCPWICGDFSGSEAPVLKSTSGGYTLRGEVPAPAFDGTVLKSLDPTGTQFEIRPAWAHQEE